MNEATSIKEDVEKNVARQHSDIIHAFFEKISQSSLCECGGITPEFKSELEHFIWLRKELHRCKRTIKSSRYVSFERFSPTTYRADIRRETLVGELYESRKKLARISPCKECIEANNPTGRKSGKIWNPNRNRALKECIM